MKEKTLSEKTFTDECGIRCTAWANVEEHVDKLKEEIILSNKTHYHWSDFTKLIDKIFGEFK